MGKKGKKKGSGDSNDKPSTSTAEQSSQSMVGLGHEAPHQVVPVGVASQPPVESTVDTQQSHQQPQAQGGKKGKKGKQQHTSTSTQAQIDPMSKSFPQPADASIPVGALQSVGRGRGHTPPPQQQQQQPSAWGRGHTPPPQQQQHQPSTRGRGPAPPPQQQYHPSTTDYEGFPSQQQQQPSAWGRGHTPPLQQQQYQPSTRGRGHAPPPQQQYQPSTMDYEDFPSQRQQQPSAWGRGHTPPPQQQHQPSTRGRGHTRPPQQHQPSTRGRGHTPPPQHQPPQDSKYMDPQQSVRGSGITPSPQPTQFAAPPLLAEQVDIKRQPQGSRGRGQAGRGARGGGVPSQRGGHVPVSTPSVDEKSVPVSISQMHIGNGDQRSGPSLQQGSRSQQAVQHIDPAGDKLQLAIYQRKDLTKGGTLGRPFNVETNHVSLKINPSLKVAFHYDVAIIPDKPKRMMRRVWDVFRDSNLRRYHIAFDDFKNAYSPDRIPDTAGEVALAEDENSKPKTYSVCIKFAAEVDLCSLFTYMQRGCPSPVSQEAVQCLDIVLRNVSALRFVRVGRSYFTPPRSESIISLGDGLELWHGFFQSAIIGWKPFLNVDVAHKGFPKPQHVVALIREMTDERTGVFDQEKCAKFLKGLKVQYEIPNQTATRRTYRVNGFVETPDVATFVHDGNRINIFNYYQRQKNYTIKERRYPCLWVGARDRLIYLPPELCIILPGQVVNRKLNEIQTSNMVKNAATDTQTRKNKIMNSLQSIQFNQDSVVKAFGLTIGNNFERVPARLLEPPSIGYKQRDVMPARGIWRAAEFLNAENLPRGSWTVFNLDRRTRDDSIHNFVRLLKQGSSQLGMQVDDPEHPFLRMERFDQRQFQYALQQHKNKRLIFVIVPDYPVNVYSKVKQVSELEIGCVTQCLKSRTMYKMNPATVGNILLKVNAKLNGNNHTISSQYRPNCLRRPCMIMGADVTHPSPDQNDIPSVAAVTASCDATGFRYNFSWRLQPAREEIIQDLENIVREQLQIFYQKTKCKPEKIIFFRDGVSEGQFRKVMNMEVQAIRRACSNMGTADTYKPKITFLVVQKRHHTRFFPTNRSESDDRNFNVRAGTVVDTEITHPTGLEYYLVSHASIQGVARPTKYRVLWDDSDIGEDELEQLTYYLCHMFSRCTRSVSYPAPTYYAHLAAFRARVYLEGHQINLGNLAQEQSRRTIRDNIRRDQPMFFV